ncbi:MAG TPA: hypothetical protein VFE90_20200, partial [Myxococcales bacterium]|nr:hypothetical protein [Myxococcales bacterium]
MRRPIDPETGLLLGALGILCATGLLELSRTLAEAYRGRWFAGNGRDLFHAGAAVVMAAALFANGLPPGLAALAAASLTAVGFSAAAPLLRGTFGLSEVEVGAIASC